MFVTITKKHLDKAIERDGYCIANQCPVAIAIKEQTHKSCEVGNYNDIDINTRRYVARGQISERRIENIIDRFDARQLSKVRRMLPVTVEIVPELQV